MKFKNNIWVYLVGLFIFILILNISLVFAEEVPAETEVYANAGSFIWKEFSDDGSERLKESGIISGIGVSTKVQAHKKLFMKLRGELFTGSMDYSGKTMGGTPVDSNTDYIGFKAEGDLGLKIISAKRGSLEPFAGMGFRSWKRDLQSTSYAIGYDEHWDIFYARLGISAEIKNSSWKAFTEVGAKFPIRNKEKVGVDLFDDTVALKPGKKVSAFAEIGAGYKRLQGAVFYEGLRFSKSGTVEAKMGGTPLLVEQPKSRSDTIGLRLGILF